MSIEYETNKWINLIESPKVKPLKAPVFAASQFQRQMRIIRREEAWIENHPGKSLRVFSENLPCDICAAVFNYILQSLSWVLDRHKLTVFYLNSFAMDSVQVGKAVFVK